MTAAHGPFHLSQTAIAADHIPPTTNWDVINTEFRSIIAPLSSDLNSNAISTTEAGDQFTMISPSRPSYLSSVVIDGLSYLPESTSLIHYPRCQYGKTD